jgi:hypothetical protein
VGSNARPGDAESGQRDGIQRAVDTALDLQLLAQRRLPDRQRRLPMEPDQGLDRNTRLLLAERLLHLVCPKCKQAYIDTAQFTPY